MNCDDVRSALYVYLDGEFAPLEATAFERHLGSCPACSKLVERERAFLNRFREGVQKVEAPSALRTRITATLQAPTPRKPVAARAGSKVLRAVALAASIALIAGTSWWIVSSGPAMTPATDDAIAAHQRNLPMEVRGSHEQVRVFLQEHVPFSVEIPYADTPGIELTGARLIQVSRRPAVLFNYEMDGRRVSVIQMGAPAGDTRLRNASPIIEDQQGYRVVTYRERGRMNSVVSNVRLKDVNRLIPATFKRY